MISKQTQQKIREACESVDDWWSVPLSTLSTLSHAMLGSERHEWVRRRREQVVVARIRYGAEAKFLDSELSSLAVATSQIKGMRISGSVLSAAAFYHLRFEKIHPLHDGNGRIGRTIMAGQLFQSLGVVPAAFERALEVRFVLYKEAFQAGDSQEVYRKLVLLLSDILRIRTKPIELPSHLSFEPVHPLPPLRR